MILTTLGPPSPGRAADPTPGPPGTLFDAEIERELRPLLARYGPDAVNLQGNLLRSAIEADSQLGSSVAIAGLIRQQDGSDLLAYDVTTGIVFRNRDSGETERIAHLWRRVVGPAHRPCKRLEIPGHGLLIRLTSLRLEDFADRNDLIRRVRAGEATSEIVSFAFSTSDVIDAAHGRITEEDLRSRATTTTTPGPVPVGAAAASSD
jgi:hypothetical protein